MPELRISNSHCYDSEPWKTFINYDLEIRVQYELNKTCAYLNESENIKQNIWDSPHQILNLLEFWSDKTPSENTQVKAASKTDFFIKPISKIRQRGRDFILLNTLIKQKHYLWVIENIKSI